MVAVVVEVTVEPDVLIAPWWHEPAPRTRHARVRQDDCDVRRIGANTLVRLAVVVAHLMQGHTITKREPPARLGDDAIGDLYARKGHA